MRLWNEGQKKEYYVVKLREGQAILIKSTQDYLKKNQTKRSSDGQVKSKKVSKFEVGNYVLLQYPNKPPDKLSGLDRRPMEIISTDRPDIIKVRDLTTVKVSFRHPTEMTKEDIEVLSAIDLDEYYVDEIVAHEEIGQNL